MSTDLPPSSGNFEVEQLLSRQEDFLRLFVKHESMVLGFIITLVPSRDDALEILQEASVVAWRKFEEFQPGTSFMNWMCRIAELKARAFRAKRNRERLHFNDELLNKIVDLRMEKNEQLADRRRALASCIEKLRDSDRKLLSERYDNQRQGKTIAETTGRPADSIYKALKRIRLMLFDCVNRTLAQEGR